MLSKKRFWKKFFEEIKQNWFKNRSKYVIGFIIFVVIAFIFSHYLSNALKPKTDINIECRITNKTGNYRLDVSFYNKADFAGEDFYVYIWKLKSASWGSDYYVSEQCERIGEDEIDFTNRFKIFCDFIPPNSYTNFSIDAELDDYTISTHKIEIEQWGKTTPYQDEWRLCDFIE